MPRPRSLSTLFAGTVLALAVLGAPAESLAAEAPPAPQVVIEKVTVTPAEPGAETLCQLHVTLRNRGDKPASELAFTVKVNGRELPAYRPHLFMARLDPGKATELRLFNFWTSETGRPDPTDGRYQIEVSLDAARWYTIEQRATEEVWTPVGAVAGLPSRISVAVGKPAARR